MTCTVCGCELTGDEEYDFSLCVVHQADESAETVIMEATNVSNE